MRAEIHFHYWGLNGVLIFYGARSNPDPICASKGNRSIVFKQAFVNMKPTTRVFLGAILELDPVDISLSEINLHCWRVFNWFHVSERVR